jgi:dihydrolipoamide dehydrogenase
VSDIQTEVLVLGGGPGGYTAAFRASDLGKSVVLVERWPTLGGVCLNVGCIPSKALLHAAKVIAETKEMTGAGLDFAPPDVDVDRLRGWKDGVTKKLTTGLAGLARRRKVTVVNGVGRFSSRNEVEVQADDGSTTVVGFEQAIVAVGSVPATLPFIPDDDPRVIDSTGALDLADLPERLLVIGGGIIGLEMATVYDELGCRVTVVEVMDQLIPGADPDLVAPLAKRIKKRYENIFLGTKVTSVEPSHVRRAVGTRQRRVRQGAGRRRSPAQRPHLWRGEGGSHGRRPRVRPRGRAAAYQRGSHLRCRRRRRAADARAQGGARGTRRR